MTKTRVQAASATMAAAIAPPRDLAIVLLVGLIAFLTVVDLFATQAILPALSQAYGVGPAAMGLAVNASTLGMAIAGIAVALFGGNLDRRRGILGSLAILSIPTALLAVAPGLASFAALRVTQGLLMATAFSLTLTYLSEEYAPARATSAIAAYITGNVASNLFGRLISAGAADHLGIAGNFLLFSGLNLLGALLVALTLHPSMLAKGHRADAKGHRVDFASAIAGAASHLSNPALVAAFGIGFCILFAFIGTFTFVNFVLARPPFGLGMMQTGYVYFVFLPSILTTPFAGGIARAFGVQRTLWASLAVAAVGLPMQLSSELSVVLAGLVLIGVGTFFAQATATGFVGRAADTNRNAASGTYLASYFLGGLVGTAILGQLFAKIGWLACVAGIGTALLLAAILAARLRLPE